MVKMKKIFRESAVALLVFLLSAAALPAEGPCPREIIRAMQDNMRGGSVYQVMDMKTVRPRYTREISVRSWSLGDDYALIYVTDPPRDAGTAFLKRGREIWNYQPAIERTVRMPPSMMSQSWMGSDFTNDDLVSASSLADDYTHQLLGEETVDGQRCHLIEIVPRPETPVAYEKSRYWITREHRLPVKVENYDERGGLVNTVHFREAREMGGRLIPTVLEMVPAGADGRKTVITIREASFDDDLGEEFFSLRNISDPRRPR